MGAAATATAATIFTLLNGVCCRCLSVHLTHAPFLTCHYFSRQPRNQLEKLYKFCKFAFGIWFIYSIRRIGYYCDSCNSFLAKQHLEGRMIGAFLDISMQRRFLCGANPDFYLVYLIVRLILPPVQYIIWTFQLWFSSNHLLKCGFVWKHWKSNLWNTFLGTENRGFRKLIGLDFVIDSL